MGQGGTLDSTVKQPRVILPEHETRDNYSRDDMVHLPTPDPSLDTPAYSGFGYTDVGNTPALGAKSITDHPGQGTDLLLDLTNAMYEQEPFHGWENWRPPIAPVSNTQYYAPLGSGPMKSV
jgi:hypothetical protein